MALATGGAILVLSENIDPAIDTGHASTCSKVSFKTLTVAPGTIVEIFNADKVESGRRGLNSGFFGFEADCDRQSGMDSGPGQRGEGKKERERTLNI